MDREQFRPIPFVLNVPHGKLDTYTKLSRNKHINGMEVSNAAKFPITRAILWNRSLIGKSFSIYFSRERKIPMNINERALLLAARHGNLTTGFLVGSIVSEQGGIMLQVDRFDPGRNVQVKTGNGFITQRVPTAHIPGDHVISLKINQSICKSDIRSAVDHDTIHRDIEILRHRVCKRHPVSVSDFFVSHATCQCQSDVNELIVNLSCCVLSFATEFVASPINDIPIIPTALAKNLSGPLRLTLAQGNPKFGYLTMDQTRKLLLLLETDPKADSLPLVGIWISGIDIVSHPYVWACCLRFVSADYIQERVLAPPSSFLLVHYPTTKAYPDFYECQNTPEQSHDSKILLTCREQLIISKSGNSKDDICLELERDEDFDMRVFSPDKQTQEELYQEDHAGEEHSIGPHEKDNDDVPTPQPSPKPFSSAAEPHPKVPSVPELSLIEEQPVMRLEKRSYNPMIYQEITSISESRTEGEASCQYVQDDRRQSQRQGEESRQLTKTSLSSTDLQQQAVDVNAGGNFLQSPCSHESTKSLNPSVVKFSEQQNESIDEIHGREVSIGASISSNSEVEGSTIPGYEGASVHADEKAAEMHTLSKIAKHEMQLMELQEQIRELLTMKRREETKLIDKGREDIRLYEDTAVQCSMITSLPEKETVGINTGDSLFFDGRRTSDTGMDYCHCCNNCRRKKGKKNSKRKPSNGEKTESEELGNEPATSNGRFVNISNTDNTYSLSDIKEGDIELMGGTNNPASTSMQSFASDFHGVDLPVFDDSHNNEPVSPNEITLGASASMVDLKNHSQSFHDTSLTNNVQMNDKRDVPPSSRNDAEFYMEMMEEVKELLDDQKEEKELEESEDVESSDVGSGETSKMSEDIANEAVAKGVVESLGMANQSNLDDISEIGAYDIHVKSSGDAAMYHPRINYVSLLGTEATDDATVLADEIALKYLTGNQIRNVQYNVTQKAKSVKFEGILQDESAFQTPKISMNFVSMNVSCNMSIATRRYMQKYNLLEGEKRSVGHNLSPRLRKSTKMLDVATVEEGSDKENEPGTILDLNKLKGLPKLM